MTELVDKMLFLHDEDLFLDEEIYFLEKDIEGLEGKFSWLDCKGRMPTTIKPENKLEKPKLNKNNSASSSKLGGRLRSNSKQSTVKNYLKKNFLDNTSSNLSSEYTTKNFS